MEIVTHKMDEIKTCKVNSFEDHAVVKRNSNESKSRNYPLRKFEYFLQNIYKNSSILILYPKDIVISIK